MGWSRLTPPSVGLATQASSPCTDLESNSVTEGEIDRECKLDLMSFWFYP